MLQSVCIHCPWRRTQIAQNLHPNSTFKKVIIISCLMGTFFFTRIFTFISEIMIDELFVIILISLTDNMVSEPQFLPGDMIHPSSSPDPIQMHAHDGPYRHPGPPSSMAGNFSSLSHSEMAGEAW